MRGNVPPVPPASPSFRSEFLLPHRERLEVALAPGENRIPAQVGLRASRSSLKTNPGIKEGKWALISFVTSSLTCNCGLTSPPLSVGVSVLGREVEGWQSCLAWSPRPSLQPPG